MTHSQSTLSTEISYERLTEVAKYVDYKKESDSLITALNDKLIRLEQVLSSEKDLVFQFEQIQVPNLKRQISILNEQNTSSERILSIREDYFKAERKRLRRGKLTFGIVGVSIGVIVGLFAL